MQETNTIASHIGNLGANIKIFFLFIIVENFLFCHLLTEERKQNMFFYDLNELQMCSPLHKHFTIHCKILSLGWKIIIL